MATEILSHVMIEHHRHSDRINIRIGLAFGLGGCSINHCRIVGFRSAKAHSFAERKPTIISRTILGRLPT
jgi:hypothetical protein